MITRYSRVDTAGLSLRFGSAVISWKTPECGSRFHNDMGDMTVLRVGKEKARHRYCSYQNPKVNRLLESAVG